jgi:hypothetical protein
MAMDYKTLQAMATNQQQHADDYCPECGRPWSDPLPEHPQRATSIPWRAALLGVLGLLLAIAFGHRTASLIEAEGYVCAIVTQTQICLVPSESVCCATSNLGPGGWTVLWASVGESAPAGGEMRRDLLVTTGGVAIILVGIGALIRPRLRARSARRPSLVLTAWSVGETLSVVVSLVILAHYANLLIILLSHGWPPASWETMDSITEEVSGLLHVVTGLC